MDWIIKRASAFSDEEKATMGITGIPADWPVEMQPYVDTVPGGWEQISDTDLTLLRANNQAAYDAWVNALRPLPAPKTPERVQPTVIFNEHLLVPRGMKKIKFIPSDYTALITLSNRSGNTFNYTSSKVPELNSFITQNDAVLRYIVSAVDTGTSTVTLDEVDGISLDDLDLAQDILLSNPITGDCEIEFEDATLLYLWGLTFQAREYGEDDFVCFRVMMPTDGGLVEIKEYERTWVSNVNKRGIMGTPDGAPGEIPAHVIIRFEYHTLLTGSTAVHINTDLILTIKP